MKVLDFINSPKMYINNINSLFEEMSIKGCFGVEIGCSLKKLLALNNLLDKYSNTKSNMLYLVNWLVYEYYLNPADFLIYNSGYEKICSIIKDIDTESLYSIILSTINLTRVIDNVPKVLLLTCANSVLIKEHDVYILIESSHCKKLIELIDSNKLDESVDFIKSKCLLEIK